MSRSLRPRRQRGEDDSAPKPLSIFEQLVELLRLPPLQDALFGTRSPNNPQRFPKAHYPERIVANLAIAAPKHPTFSQELWQHLALHWAEERPTLTSAYTQQFEQLQPWLVHTPAYLLRTHERSKSNPVAGISKMKVPVLKVLCKTLQVALTPETKPELRARLSAKLSTMPQNVPLGVYLWAQKWRYTREEHRLEQSRVAKEKRCQARRQAVADRMAELGYPQMPGRCKLVEDYVTSRTTSIDDIIPTLHESAFYIERTNFPKLVAYYIEGNYDWSRSIAVYNIKREALRQWVQDAVTAGQLQKAQALAQVPEQLREQVRTLWEQLGGPPDEQEDEDEENMGDR